MYKWCETIYIYFALSVRAKHPLSIHRIYTPITHSLAHLHSHSHTHTRARAHRWGSACAYTRAHWHAVPSSTIYTNICIENESQSVSCLSNRSQHINQIWKERRCLFLHSGLRTRLFFLSSFARLHSRLAKH